MYGENKDVTVKWGGGKIYGKEMLNVQGQGVPEWKVITKLVLSSAHTLYPLHCVRNNNRPPNS